jgi:hypothetical protein
VDVALVAVELRLVVMLLLLCACTSSVARSRRAAKKESMNVYETISKEDGDGNGCDVEGKEGGVSCLRG